MHKPSSQLFRATFAIIGACALAGCEFATDSKSDSGSRTAPITVHIQPSHNLELPHVGSVRAYRPTCLASLRTEDGDRIPDALSPSAVMFELNITTTQFDQLNAELTDRDQGTTSALIQLKDAPNENSSASCQDTNLSTEATSLLADNHAVFWVDPQETSASPNKRNVVVAIPATMLSASTSLEFFADETSTSDSLGGDRIELVQDFFYLTVLGDSVMWGNGLLEGDKLSSLVANAIESATRRKVIRSVYAMSGATLSRTPIDEECTFQCSGEVPTAYRSINFQIDTVIMLEKSDLILMDGCINDVDIGKILNTESTPEGIIEATEFFCNDIMRETLIRLDSIAPNVPIVVTGYFPFVSSKSDFSSLFNWAQTQGFDVGNVDLLADIAATFANHSEVFYETSTSALQSAIIAATQQRTSANEIVLVDPGIGPEHAVFTEDSWVWDLKLDRELARRLGLDIGLVPEDPQLIFRSRACFEDGSLSDPFTCIFASVGHPNVKGAKAYAEAILKALRETGQLLQ